MNVCVCVFFCVFNQFVILDCDLLAFFFFFFKGDSFKRVESFMKPNKEKKKKQPFNFFLPRVCVLVF